MTMSGPRTILAFSVFLALAVLLLPQADAWIFGRRSSSSSSSSSSQPSGGPISSSCYRPSGTDCNWYRDCLERKIPCSGQSGDYAIAYAENYCNRYTSNYNRFSDAGKRWVTAVKKCLQVKLVPVLRQSPAPSCSSVKTQAFDSHVPCYTNPGYGAPSFCDLSFTDKGRVFTTIYTAFRSEFQATVSGGWQTLRNCYF